MVTQESTQDRCALPPVDSEVFHQTALNRRLERIRVESPTGQSSDSFQILDQTMNQSNTHRKFNLNQFLHNSVYPVEWTPDDAMSTTDRSILNASIQIDHLRTSKPTSLSDASIIQSERTDNVQFDPNDTVVDEELILSLTQKPCNQSVFNETLNENEHEVLDIFELLEEDDPHDETLRIDDDSALAPLSQRRTEQINLSQKPNLNKSVHETSFEEHDSDDDLLNEFSMSMLDCLPDDLETGDRNAAEEPNEQIR